MKKIILQILMMCSAMYAVAQFPHDAIYMPKKTACVAGVYSNTSWKEYWEGNLQRENLNIGKHTTQSYMLMGAYGITDKLNVIAMAPYVATKNSAGNFAGMSGLQDFSAFFKYKVFEITGLSIHTTLGGSLPMTNYTADFLPNSIGIKTKTASGRLVTVYQHEKTGLYANLSAAYLLRSNIRLDKDSYYAYNRTYNTNEVEIPNAFDAAFRLGFRKKGIQIEGIVSNFQCTYGDNIRRNDMPFPTNNMQATQAGVYTKLEYKKFSLMLQAMQTLKGQNVGKSLGLMAGIGYQI
jgi:hypothetical protein